MFSADFSTPMAIGNIRRRARRRVIRCDDNSDRLVGFDDIEQAHDELRSKGVDFMNAPLGSIVMPMARRNG